MSIAAQFDDAGGGGRSIEEASLGRIWQQFNDRAFAILTSWRDKDNAGEQVPLEINQANFVSIKKDIRSAGFGFVPLRGVGQELETGTYVPTDEPCLLVPVGKAGPDDGSLYQLAVRLGRANDQDRIVYHNLVDGQPVGAVLDPGAAPGDAKAIEPALRHFKPDMIANFYSRLAKGAHAGRPFHPSAVGSPPRGAFEWVGVKFEDPPQNWIAGMGREASGEVRFDLVEDLRTWIARFREHLDERGTACLPRYQGLPGALLAEAVPGSRRQPFMFLPRDPDSLKLVVFAKNQQLAIDYVKGQALSSAERRSLKFAGKGEPAFSERHAWTAAVVP